MICTFKDSIMNSCCLVKILQTSSYTFALSLNSKYSKSYYIRHFGSEMKTCYWSKLAESPVLAKTKFHSSMSSGDLMLPGCGSVSFCACSGLHMLPSAQTRNCAFSNFYYEVWTALYSFPNLDFGRSHHFTRTNS